MEENNLKLTTIGVACIFTIFFCALSSAENSDAPFETLKVSLNMAINTNTNIFHDYWNQSPAADLMVEFPFYTGSVQAGLQIAHNSSVQSDAAGYTSIFLYLGWGWEIDLPYRLKWYNGVQAGNYQMIFDENRRSGAEKRESEFGAGLYSRLTVPIRANWSFSFYSSYRKIYTYRQIHHTFVGVGMGCNLCTPAWLKEFLR